jgi:branched-chain amino acid transport system ATP-binding protein
MSSTPILRTENLSRRFGGLQAVCDVTMEIREGTIHSIIGPNGAGKSTLFNLLTGRLPPNEGKVFFRDRKISGMPLPKVARLGLARSYQITTIFRKLTVLDNLMVAAQSALAFTFWRPAMSYDRTVEESMALLELIGLEDKAGELAGHLSHGEQRHLDMAIALRTRPQILLLDEPTAGMSPYETEQTVTLIKELSRTLTVVLVEHKMEMIMRISDRITVLNFGRVLADGTPSEIQANPAVRQAYLGSASEDAEVARTQGPGAEPCAS